MKMSFSQARKIVPLALNDGKSVMFRGIHGIGKSQFFMQMAEDMGLPFIDRRLSQVQEADLLGLPFQGEYNPTEFDGKEEINMSVTEFSPPKWLKRACTEPVFVLLDEINRASPQVGQLIFQLGDSRELYGNKLHPDTKIATCVNKGPEYNVRQMDPAGLDRWVTWDLSPTKKEWIQWAKNNDVHSVIVNFLKEHRELIDPSDEEIRSSDPTPSRRSWTWASNALKNGIERYGEDFVSSPEARILLAGFVGESAASHWSSYAENRKPVLGIEDLLEDEEKREEAIEKYDLMDWLNVADDMYNTKMMREKQDKETMYTIARIFTEMPAEAKLEWWRVMGSPWYREQSNTRIEDLPDSGEEMEELLKHNLYPFIKDAPDEIGISPGDELLDLIQYDELDSTEVVDQLEERWQEEEEEGEESGEGEEDNEDE